MSDRVDIRRAVDFVMARNLLMATKTVRQLLVSPTPYDDNAKAITQLEKTLSAILAIVNPDETDAGPLKDRAESSTMAARKPIRSITFLTFTFRSVQRLPFILSSSLILGWCQFFPPTRFLSIRKSIIDLFKFLPPSECLSMLGAVLGLVATKRRPAPKLELLDDRGVSQSDPGWPSYVGQTAQVLMGKQLVRQGGVKGLMANVFGASMGKNEGTSVEFTPDELRHELRYFYCTVIDTFKVDRIAQVLARVPVGMPSEVRTLVSSMTQTCTDSLYFRQTYYESLASQLNLIIRPPPKTAAYPDQYIHGACYVVYHLLVNSERQFAPHVVPRLHKPFLPVIPVAVMDDMEGQTIQLSASEDVEGALGLLLPLLTHAPPSVALLRMLVLPILTQLIALASAMSKDSTSDALTKGELEGVLRAWARLTDEDEAGLGLVSAVTSGRGWNNRTADGRETFWAKSETKVSGFGVFFGR